MIKIHCSMTNDLLYRARLKILCGKFSLTCRWFSSYAVVSSDICRIVSPKLQPNFTSSRKCIKPIASEAILLTVRVLVYR